jgi:peptidoglycan/LPS O-acetylase OafA/YrhL
LICIIFKSAEKPHDLYSAFSVHKNGKTLFHIESKAGKSSYLQCLSGLRTLAMLHILLGHRFEWVRAYPMINANILAPGGEWMTSFVSAFVAIHPIAVDTFFVIGGFLLSRSMLSQIENGKLNIPKLYLHRYLRITPVYAFLILFVVSVFKFMGDGPLWRSTINGNFVTTCQDNWWPALLHIQNYHSSMESVIQSIF